MNLQHLEYLLAVVDTGSFSRAAERLQLTQSALSRSIQALEVELGGLLLDRMGKRHELTPLGHAVVQSARRITFEAGELLHGVRLLHSGGWGALRVGMGSGPGALLMTPLLQHMARHHPKIKVTVLRGSPELQLQQLRDRSLDALVIDERRVAPAADLRIEHQANLQVAAICRKSHPLGRHDEVTFSRLLDYPVASTPLSDGVARWLVQTYGPQADPAQMITLCCEEVSSLIETVRETDAIFIGIRAAAQAHLASGELLELKISPAFPSAARFALVTLVGRTEGAAMALLRSFVAQRLRD
jgi:DNA-binding transcriptional LysR family regulator